MDAGKTRDASTLNAGRHTLQAMAMAGGNRGVTLPPKRFAAGPKAQIHALGRAQAKDGPVARAKRAFRRAFDAIDRD
jgi:hypothetical protein